MNTSAPSRVLAELARLQRDEDAVARAVGAAVTAAVLDALDDDERRWIGDIEGLRSAMEASPELIDVALANRRGVVKPAELGDTCRRRSKTQQWGVFLLALARTLGVDRGVELGTCLGISSAYLAAGMRLAGRGHLVTLEGARALAERSAKNLAALGLGKTEVVAGLFADTLGGVLDGGGTVGLSFIDGHHHEEPTLAYFDTISRYLADPAVVVFDDIRWSDGMEAAWGAILADPRVRVAIDLTSVGVCVVTPPSTVPARVYRFPTVTAMHAALAHLAERDPAGVIDPPPGDVARLNWAPRPAAQPGWLNLSVDIRHGLPVADARIDYVASMHALPTVPLMDVLGALHELRRVLKPGGTLRLGVRDFERTLDAYARGDKSEFVVSDRDAETASGKLITEAVWYGLEASPFTAEYLGELLRKAGFSDVQRCAYRQTASGHAGITELDDRPEALFVEARR